MALFTTDTLDFRQVVPVNINFTMDALLPHLERVELDILPRFLGDELTGELLQLADESPQETSIEGKLLRLLRQIVGNLGFAAYMPFADTQIDDNGITTGGSGNRKAAFEYQYKKLERSCLDAGWEALDRLIGLIAKHADDYPAWQDSPYFSEHQEAFFTSAAEFSQFYPIQDRWLTFWALRPFIRLVEEDKGAMALARVNEALEDDDDPRRKPILKSLRRALALESVLLGIPQLSIEINGTNVQVNYASQYGNISYFQPPARDHLEWVCANIQRMLDLAWTTFETGMEALNPPAEDDAEDGYYFGGDKIVML